MNTLEQSNTIEADFKEIPPPTSSTAIATLESLQLYRHQLKQGTSNPKIQQIAKELELDKQLGLKNQAEITAESALQHDIDELTNSNNYFQVSKSLLEKLFSINSLQLKCLWYNIKSWISNFIHASPLQLSLISIVATTVYPLIKLCTYLNSKPETAIIFLLVLLCIIAWMGELVLTAIAITKWTSNFDMNYEELKVKLDMTPLKLSNIKIPYGAKLKLQEAIESNIFQDFIIARPSFIIERKEIHNRFNIDPAIIGVTKDLRMFMIVYWDIKKDKEKIINQINYFKKFKLES